MGILYSYYTIYARLVYLHLQKRERERSLWKVSLFQYTLPGSASMPWLGVLLPRRERSFSAKDQLFTSRRIVKG